GGGVKADRFRDVVRRQASWWAGSRSPAPTFREGLKVLLARTEEPSAPLLRETQREFHQSLGVRCPSLYELRNWGVPRSRTGPSATRRRSGELNLRCDGRTERRLFLAPDRFGMR